MWTARDAEFFSVQAGEQAGAFELGFEFGFQWTFTSITARGRAERTGRSVSLPG